MKKIRHTLLALLVFALICSACPAQAEGLGSNANADTQRYECGVFSYAVPTSWSSKEEQAGGLAQHWHYAGELGETEEGYLYTYNQILFITEAQEQQALESAVDTITNSSEFVRLISCTYGTVADCPALRLTVILEHDGVPHRSAFLYVLHNQSLLSVMCLYPEADAQEAFMDAFTESVAVDTTRDAAEAWDPFTIVERYQSEIFSYDMPLGWIAEEDHANALLERWHYANEGAYDEGWCFDVRLDPASGMSAAEELAFLEEMIEVMREEADSLQVITLESLTVAGCDAIRCAFLIGNDGWAESRSFLFLLHKDYLFSIMSFYPEDKAQEQETYMDKIVSSIAVDTTRDPPDRWGAFEDVKRRQDGIFSYDMPSGWIVVQNNSDGYLEHMYYANVQDYAKGWCFRVCVEPVSGLTVEEELARIEENNQALRERVKSLRVTHLESCKVAGYDAIRLAFLIENDGGVESRSYVSVIHKEYRFTVLSFYPESEAEMQETYMNKVAASIAVDDGEL